MSADFRQYTVTLQSVPGMYAQYGPGDVRVWARDDQDAIVRALKELRQTAFPDRFDDCWKVLRVASAV